MQERQLRRLDSLKKALDKISKAQSIAKECEICHKEFGLLRFKHFCARCTRIICADCGENKRLIWTSDHTKPRRVCFDCEKEDKFQELFREMNKTSWGCLSVYGQEWRKKCELSLEDGHHPEASYSELLKLANTSPEGYKDFLSIEKDVMRGRSDRNVFNPSIREFLFHNQGNLDTKSIQIQICNVLKAFCVSHPFIGYCQGMNYIVAFLLSLMDEESAYLIFSHVVTRILPKNYYGKPHQGDSLLGLQQEKFVIVNLAKDHFKLDDKGKEKVDYFLDIYSTGFMIPLFVDYFNYEVLFNIWKRLVYTQSMNEIRKIVLYIIGIFLEKILAGSLEKSFEIRNRLITDFTIDHFHQAQSIEIDNSRVYQLEEEFKQDYASKWMSNKTFVYSLLQRHTHFSKSEIQSLQEQYKVFLDAHTTEEGQTSEHLKPVAVRGVNKQQFVEIVNHVIKEDHEVLDYVEALSCDHIFEVFDLDDTGYLDFKELVFCLSMLIRGSLDEKIEFAFQVFDKEEKGYLEPEEYHCYVRSLIKASKMVRHNSVDPVFDKELAQFEAKLLGLAKGAAEVKYGDIHNALLGDTFIEYCHNLAQPKEPEPAVSIIDRPESPTEEKKDTTIVEKKE